MGKMRCGGTSILKHEGRAAGKAEGGEGRLAGYGTH